MNRLIAPIAAVALAACSTLGVPAADTTAKKIAAAHASVAAGADEAFAMRAAGKMSFEAKNSFADRLSQFEVGIAALESVPNLSAADSRLTVIIAALTALQAELAKPSPASKDPKDAALIAELALIALQHTQEIQMLFMGASGRDLTPEEVAAFRAKAQAAIEKLKAQP